MRRARNNDGPKLDARRATRGVTLIELIVVITITAIIATVLGVIVVRPIQGYQAQVRRAELVDAAEMALRRMGREIRLALPNTVRVRDALGTVDNVTCNDAGQLCSIEILRTVDGARYRVGPGVNPGGHGGLNHANPQYRLQVPGLDGNGFNIIGEFQNFRPTLPFSSTSERLAIYNQSASGPNSAYADAVLGPGLPYVITNPNAPQNTRFTLQDDGGGDEWQLLPNGTPNFNFRWDSPNQRMFIVDTPVSYVCNAGTGGNLTRHSNYPITPAQQSTPAGGSSARMSAPVTACTFSYSPGSNERTGLVTMSLTLTDPDSGEQVNLLYQVHVDNFP
jgi:MSHA biogenesis protein MshO